MSSPESPVPPAPTPHPAGSSEHWMKIAGALFGAVTLAGMFALVLLASKDSGFLCNTNLLVAAVFALGAALAVSFIGGVAAVEGRLGASAQHNALTYSAGGGIAVLIIVFMLFYLQKPDEDICRQREDSRRISQSESILQINQIPAALSHTVSTELWTQREDQEKRKRFRINVLVRDTKGMGDVEFYLGEAEKNVPDAPSECAIAIQTTTDDHVIEAGVETSALKRSKFGRSIPITYQSAKTANALKADPVCFYIDKKPIAGLISISLVKDEIVFASPGKLVEERARYPGQSYAANSLPSTGALAWLNPFASAFAEDATPSYAELKRQLGSAGASHISARQYLAANFERYSVEAMQDLLNADPSQPQVTVGLLHGLIAGIDARTGGTLKPGRPRILSDSLPYVGGHEAVFVDMTGNPNEAVRKQARRLVQRYPMNGFDRVYRPRVTAAADGNCAAGPDPKSAEGVIYSSIFFYHNRIVQKNYAETLQKTDAEDAEQTAALVKKAAKNCLPPDLQVDAALVDFGRAIIYSEANGASGAYRPQAEAAAMDFLQDIKGREADYYFSGHIDQMKQLVPSGAAIGRKPNS